jgi:hypothetical protein
MSHHTLTLNHLWKFSSTTTILLLFLFLLLIIFIRLFWQMTWLTNIQSLLGHFESKIGCKNIFLFSFHLFKPNKKYASKVFTRYIKLQNYCSNRCKFFDWLASTISGSKHFTLNDFNAFSIFCFQKLSSLFICSIFISP